MDPDGAVSSRTPAIVLVHGIASATANWDFTSTWSTARALASAGYVVYSYDRLGYAKGPYFDVPGDGFTLTTREHRRMLHEIVDEVKDGAYSTTSGADCSGVQQPGGTSNRTVVIIGHSAGGWIVAGYPGTYCGCDVSQIILPATGHLFQVHASLAGLVNDVVSWLGARGLGA